MKTKIALVAVLTVTAGAFFYARPHNHIPSDLRDAPADNAVAFGELKSGSSGVEAPVPAEPAAVEAPAPESADIRARALPVSEIFNTASEKSADRSARAALTKSAAPASREYAPEELGPLRLAPGEAPFEKLREMFSKGVPATQKDMDGIRVGRFVTANGDVYGKLLGCYAGRITGRVRVRDMAAKRHVGADYFEHVRTIWAVLEHYEVADRWDIKFPEAIAAYEEDKELIQEFRVSDGWIVAEMRRHGEPGAVAYSYYFILRKIPARNAPTIF
ncbi:MAG: hypothetical protein M0011_00195 [Elusimicrobia bacterium]|nr:hypothetical protein [Elusimicrobiota bacterium]